MLNTMEQPVISFNNIRIRDGYGRIQKQNLGRIADLMTTLQEILSEPRYGTLKNAYRIDLLMLDHHANLILHVNTAAWAKLVLYQMKPEPRFDLLMSYEQMLMEHIAERNSEDSLADSTRIEEIPPVCRCQTPKSCTKVHNAKECRVELKRLTGTKGYCKEVIHPLMVVPIVCDQKFRSLARFEPVRELLLVPIDHIPNEDLIVEKDFWSLCVITIIRLENLIRERDATFRGIVVSKISLNFGE